MVGQKNTARIIVGLVLGTGYFVAMWTILSSQHSSDPLIIFPSSIDLHYDPEGHTLTERGEQEDCDAVINGGYFGYDEGKYVPAGVWHQGDDIRPHTSPSDPNLKHTVSIFRGTNEGIIEQKLGKIASIQTHGVDRFSSGPLLVVEGERYLESGQSVSHRADEYSRTVLLIDHNKRISFALFREPVTLDDVVESLLGIGSDITAINLDGGPSAAYRSHSKPELSFHSGKKLPIIMCLEI